MLLQKIVNFYKKYENLNLKIAFILISLQIIHLYWLTTDVVLLRIFGETFFAFPQIPADVFAFIDYIEVPALVSGITFYALSVYNNKKVRRNSLMLVLLAIQVFHIFWITDEIVYDMFFGTVPIAIPVYLAWIAILIDYLEIPVMVDLFKKVFLMKKNKSARS
jgi:hypothetical protein